jgi:hypothetical protein
MAKWLLTKSDSYGLTNSFIHPKKWDEDDIRFGLALWVIDAYDRIITHIYHDVESFLLPGFPRRRGARHPFRY